MMMKATTALLLALSPLTTYASAPLPQARAFLPRGGALGPLEPLKAAQIFGGVQLVQGVLQTLSPSAYRDLYGVDNDGKGSSSACNAKLIRAQGISLLQQGVMAYLLFAQDLSTEQAGGVASLGFAAESLSSLLNQDSDSVGPAKWVDALTLASAGAAAVAGLSGLGWATTALKVTGVCHICLSGLPLLAFPEKVANKVLKLKGTNGSTTSLVRGLGWALASTGTLLSCLAWGTSTATAFGASMVVTAVSAAKYLVTAGDDVLGVKQGAVVAWTLVPAALAAAVFLDL